MAVPAFAQGNTNNVKDSGVKDSGFSYISQNDALLLAKQCIVQQTKSGNHCIWNSSTKVSETVKTYDFDNNVNSYLFRLMTNNKKEGYIFVDASYESPCVQAFGYDCNFILDSINMKNHKRLVNKNDNIIYAGGLTFLQKVNNYQVKELSTNKIVKEDIKNLRDSYKQLVLQTNDSESKANFNQLKNIVTQNNIMVSESILKTSQTIYDKHDLPNIWKNPSSNTYITSDFHQDNCCAPTAGTNFIYYWSHLSPNKHPELWLGTKEVEKRLYDYFYTNITTPGTMPYNIVPGLSNYGGLIGSVVAGSDYVNDGTNWEWYTANIKHNLPIIFTVADDPKYQQHVMLIVGYQLTSAGKYFRVANGWDRTYSNFYKQAPYIINACYVRR
jgi:hypothetical protein